jgi:signal recognition particle subunit SRP68
LLLLTSERAWAQAMSFKTGHDTDQKGITGRTRSHIVSRLDKAARTAETLAEILTDSAAGASSNDVLEAKAYAAMIRGAMQFEKQSWEACLRSYATARVIYSALASAVKGDIFKDLLSETIDPSIRYAAYQLKTPRTVPIPVIARKTFPENDAALTEQVNKLDPRILRQGDAASQREAIEGEEGPRTLTWRSREVKIEDAQIATAWGSVLQAKEKLADKIEKDGSNLTPQETAAAYEEVLMTTQDAVDATKQAIDELRGEGVGQADARMQSLQITRTAVNYEMISWRIGRNRVLTGAHDGAPEGYTSRVGRRKRKGAGDAEAQPQREPPQSRKLSKLKEKAALYDGTLQNLDSVKELPGVAADEELATRLNAYSDYFESLKYVSNFSFRSPTCLEADLLC